MTWASHEQADTTKVGNLLDTCSPPVAYFQRCENKRKEITWLKRIELANQFSARQNLSSEIKTHFFKL
jgi:hypothetical protein